MPNSKVILVEDDTALRIATSQTLELGGFEVLQFGKAEDAGRAVDSRFEGVILTDVRLPGRSGMDLLREVSTVDPDIPVILVTAHGDINMAVDAMRAGAYDFVTKPFASECLLGAVKRASEKRSLIMEDRLLRRTSRSRLPAPLMIGESEALNRVRAQVASLGPTAVDILINGETGTGKEVIARQLHVMSERTGPFVAINCGALPESIFESEMFGHEAGAYTGAQKRRIGKFEYASGGTIFLDEIESMPLSLQVKLLRVLQERRVERIGGNQLIPIDCRVIAATKTDLIKLSEKGEFRTDLFYRIGVVTIDLPRLAHRREDIPLLLSHFVAEASCRFGRPMPFWSEQDMSDWMRHEWPGNVRELRNFADRLVLGMAQQPDYVGPKHSVLSNNGLPRSESLLVDCSLREQVGAYEKIVISEALTRSKASVTEAADLLRISKKTLYDKIKRLGIPIKE
ncbi:sigma-54-dependent transcriptional regulator [Noviherbaspirillum sp. Root189]|uniref:sigma-54-dependent transcriptional regulator n=1 Tax=Noviherbaspirillum sp. Root189 TaxID=1736487 RepID=UPI00070C386D|nr:sigma-54 dependent transcriptional regulator [Noviherbaspirillum sp. Root189]KRB68011.1 Fis family transcriptional regulator [Noviherbaspirillum sp. Root189]